MKLSVTLKALPFLSLLVTSLMLAPGASMAGDNAHGAHKSQYKHQYNQHERTMARQAHRRSNSRRVINHQYQARPHYSHGNNNQHGVIKRHYSTPSHYSYNEHDTYLPPYNAHTYTVTRAYHPAPVVYTPALTLGLHTGNVILSLNSH